MNRRGKILFGTAAALIALLVVAGAYPFVVGDMETTVLDDALRATMPDRHFIRLSDGVTHYEWAGPEEGSVVVLVHGFSGGAFIWDRQIGALADAGLRVLRYDLYGRGYSDRPRIRYDADLFDGQLIELLDALGVAGPVDVVGLSMGGAITMHFLDRHPERVRRYALIAPAGFPVDVPLRYRAVQWPLFGEWLMKLMGDQTLIRNIARPFQGNPDEAAAFVALYTEPMRYKGYKRALLSTLRHNPLLTLRPVYARAGQKPHPGLLIWGDQDHVVPFDHHAQVIEAIPHIAFHAIAGAGHTVNYEVPEIVNPILIEFLKRNN